MLKAYQTLNCDCYSGTTALAATLIWEITASLEICLHHQIKDKVFSTAKHKDPLPGAIPASQKVNTVRQVTSETLSE